MKHVLFYFSSLTPSRLPLWSRCFEELSDQIGINISVFFEKDSDLQVAKTGSHLDPYLIQPEENRQSVIEYAPDKIADILSRYDEYNLQKYRLQKMTLNEPKGLSVEYLQQLCFVITQLEELLDRCNPDLIFVMEPKNIAWTANLFLLEMICRVEQVGFRFVHVLGSYSRLNVFDNLFRVSTDVHKTFKSKLAQGLSKAEIERVEQFIASYRSFKTSRFVKDILQKKNTRERSWLEPRSIRRRVLQYLVNTRLVSGRSSRPLYPKTLDLTERRYILFLPNKPDNGRAQYLAPYYSDCNSVLVRALALSMPIDCALVIKDHPHTVKRGISRALEKVVNRFDNCYYLDPREDSMEIAANSAAVASVASTSGLEALMLKKHLILFGETNLNFGSEEAPIKRVTNLEDLPMIINDCLTEDPPAHEILVWIYAVLANSFSWGLVDDRDWTNHSNQGFEQKSVSLIKTAIINVLRPSRTTE